MSYVPQPDYNDEEASKITQALKRSPSGKGFVHFASDGVYRAYSSSGDVTDYKQLSPPEIAIMMASFKPLVDSESFAKLEAKMDGKDGRDVTDLDHLLHPGPDVRPPKPTQRMTHPTRSTSPSGAT